MSEGFFFVNGLTSLVDIGALEINAHSVVSVENGVIVVLWELFCVCSLYRQMSRWKGPAYWLLAVVRDAYPVASLVCVRRM